MGTGEVGLSATAFPSFQGPWAGLDVPGDIWMATTAPALPTRTQHAVSTARLHPSFLPSGVSRTIEPRQAGRPVAGRPARGRSEAAPPPRRPAPAAARRPGHAGAAGACGAAPRRLCPVSFTSARGTRPAAGSSTAGEPTSPRTCCPKPPGETSSVCIGEDSTNGRTRPGTASDPPPPPSGPCATVIGERGGWTRVRHWGCRGSPHAGPPPISSAVYWHTPTHGSVGDRQPAVVMAVDGTEPDEPERGADDGGPQTVVEDPVAGVIPMSGWLLRYNGFDPPSEGLREALCALGNGRFVTRAAAPEARADEVHYPGTYAAGVFNRLVDERSGRQIENESIVNLPDWQSLTFRAEDGDWVELATSTVDPLRAGTRSAPRDTDPPVPGPGRRGAAHRGGPTPGRVDGRPVPGLPGRTFVAENWSGVLVVRSGIDGRVTNSGVPRYRGLADRHLVVARGEEIDDDIVALTAETTQSAIRVSLAARQRVLLDDKPVKVERDLVAEDGYIGQDIRLDLHEGERHTVEKVVALYTSRDRAITEPGRAARDKARRAPDLSDLLARHVLAWDHLWERCDLRISGHERADLVLHLHLFQLLQTLSAHSVDLDVGIPARGLHGEAYRGHIFWDDVVRVPLPEPADARTVAGAAALPVAAAAAGPRGGPRDRLPGRDVPLAERVQRPGGNPDPAPEPALGPVDPGQLPPAAPHQRLDRLQHLEVLRGDRRHRLPRPARRGDHLRGREVLVQPGQLRPRRRPVRPARGDGTRRVPRRLPVAGRAGAGQQRLHQRDGRLGAHPRAGMRGGAARPAPRGAAGPARDQPGGAGALGAPQPQDAAVLARRRDPQPVRGI